MIFIVIGIALTISGTISNADSVPDSNVFNYLKPVTEADKQATIEETLVKWAKVSKSFEALDKSKATLYLHDANSYYYYNLTTTGWTKVSFKYATGWTTTINRSEALMLNMGFHAPRLSLTPNRISSAPTAAPNWISSAS